MRASVFVLWDGDTRVLMEKRGPGDAIFPNGQIFPAGKLKDDELPWQCMVREVGEELGVTPVRWYQLATDRHLYYSPTEHGDRVYESGYEIPELAKWEIAAYLVSSWQGSIPDEILDTRNRLLWCSFDEALTGHGCTIAIIEAIRRFLDSHPGAPSTWSPFEKLPEILKRPAGENHV